MDSRKIALGSLIFLMALATGCRTYKSNIMFKTKDFENDPALEARLKQVESNYKMRVNDRFTIRVETNQGEALVDPNLLMRQELSQGAFNQNIQNRNPVEYTIQADGQALLPMIGKVSLQGLTIFQVDSLLSSQYAAFYQEPYARTSLLNRRVVVFNGEDGAIVPLDNEAMSILEVIAYAGGISNSSKAFNIRLIRGDLKNPYVEVIDLSTIQGMKAANLQAQENDVIYIEPVRRVFLEATRDITPLLTLTTSLLTLTILILSL